MCCTFVSTQRAGFEGSGSPIQDRARRFHGSLNYSRMICSLVAEAGGSKLILVALCALKCTFESL